MAFETKTETIGAHDYKMTQLGAITGRKVFLRVAGILAMLQEGKLGDAIKAISDEDQEFLCDTFGKVSSVKIGDEWIKLADRAFQDMHFAGNYKEMYGWIMANLSLNFKDLSPKDKGLEGAEKPSK